MKQQRIEREKERERERAVCINIWPSSNLLLHDSRVGRGTDNRVPAFSLREPLVKDRDDASRFSKRASSCHGPKRTMGPIMGRE